LRKHEMAQTSMSSPEMLPRSIARYIEDRTEWLVETTRTFIRTPSVSGSEGEIAALLVKTLQALGLSAFIDTAGNVVGSLNTLQGKGRAGTILAFNVHMDTVPPGSRSSWRKDPFGAEIEDVKMYGRGASDCKGAWAPMILAMDAIKNAGAEDGLRGEVLFTAVVMEELTCSFGMKVLHDSTLKNILPDYVVLGEPTGLNIATGHKGRMELEITTSGRACHASVPWNGNNALYKAAAAISSMERLAAEIESLPQDPVFGTASLAITDIRCSPGTRNVIPAACTLYGDYRFLPGESLEHLLNQVRERLKKDHVDARVAISERDETTWTGVTFKGEKSMSPFVLDDNHPLVRIAVESVREATGVTPRTYKWNFATDGAYSMGGLGIPTIGFSPCEENLAHVVDEYVRIDCLALAAKAYATMIFKLLL
jgi:putative selenium metabolism hydrolase